MNKYSEVLLKGRTFTPSQVMTSDEYSDMISIIEPEPEERLKIIELLSGIKLTDEHDSVINTIMNGDDLDVCKGSLHIYEELDNDDIIKMLNLFSRDDVFEGVHNGVVIPEDAPVLEVIHELLYELVDESGNMNENLMTDLNESDFQVEVTETHEYGAVSCLKVHTCKGAFEVRS